MSNKPFALFTAIDTRVEEKLEYLANRGIDNVVELQPVESDGDTDTAVDTVAEETAKLQASLEFPIAVLKADVREIYKRKAGKTGTRIVYHDTSARIVKDDYAAVLKALNS